MHSSFLDCLLTHLWALNTDEAFKVAGVLLEACVIPILDITRQRAAKENSRRLYIWGLQKRKDLHGDGD